MFSQILYNNNYCHHVLYKHMTYIFSSSKIQTYFGYIYLDHFCFFIYVLYLFLTYDEININIIEMTSFMHFKSLNNSLENLVLQIYFCIYSIVIPSTQLHNILVIKYVSIKNRSCTVHITLNTPHYYTIRGRIQFLYSHKTM